MQEFTLWVLKGTWPKIGTVGLYDCLKLGFEEKMDK